MLHYEGFNSEFQYFKAVCFFENDELDFRIVSELKTLLPVLATQKSISQKEVNFSDSSEGTIK